MQRAEQMADSRCAKSSKNGGKCTKRLKNSRRAKRLKLQIYVCLGPDLLAEMVKNPCAKEIENCLMTEESVLFPQVFIVGVCWLGKGL